jgi:hypothetical protein
VSISKGLRVLHTPKVMILVVLLGLAPMLAAAGEVAEADANRKKPLQRCDQLSDKAEIECLKKARERIVEARRKRETASTKAVPAAASSTPTADKKDAAAIPSVKK